MEAQEAPEEALYEAAIKREALYEAAIKRVTFYKRDQIQIEVTRPITVVACRGVRRRACDYRHVVACVVATSWRLSPTSPIRLAEFHACPDLFQFRRLQEFLQDVANVPGRLAFQDG